MIQDLFTKWIEVKTLISANGKLIKGMLEDLVINRWGAPRVLVTDNGTEFINKMIKDFAEKYRITHRTVPPYHTQANPVERLNCSLKIMIVAYLERDLRDWDSRLKEFRFVYNNAYHSFGTTLAFLNLGRDLEPIYAIRREGRDDSDIPAGDAAAWVQRMRQMRALREWVWKNLERAQDRKARHYNMRR